MPQEQNDIVVETELAPIQEPEHEAEVPVSEDTKAPVTGFNLKPLAEESRTSYCRRMAQVIPDVIEELNSIAQTNSVMYANKFEADRWLTETKSNLLQAATDAVDAHGKKVYTNAEQRQKAVSDAIAASSEITYVINEIKRLDDEIRTFGHRSEYLNNVKRFCFALLNFESTIHDATEHGHQG